MTWTYDPTELTTNEMMRVRFIVGDTDTDHQEVQDEEIEFAISVNSSLYAASAIVARSIAAKYTRKVDEAAGDHKKSYSQRAKAFLALYYQLNNQAMATGGGLPYAGGISRIDKRNQENDTDRVKPQFNLDMDDNRIPVGAAGNETQE